MNAKVGKKKIIIIIVSSILAAVVACLVIACIDISYGFFGIFLPRAQYLELETLKPGKYFLERESGLDETEYIEVFEDETVQFVGEYWTARDLENADMHEVNPSEPLATPFTKRNCYVIDCPVQFVKLCDDPSVFNGEGGSISTGFYYEDENTLEATRKREEANDIPDYNKGPDGKPKYNADIVIAHYIYSE